MSLSKHEKIQFERLTAGFVLDDPSTLKRMVKRDRATAMSYVALPSRNTILMALAIVGLLVGSGGGIAANVIFILGAVSSLLLFTNVMLSSRAKPSVANRKTKKGE